MFIYRPFLLFLLVMAPSLKAANSAAWTTSAAASSSSVERIANSLLRQRGNLNNILLQLPPYHLKDAELVKALLDQQANPYMQDKITGETLLHRLALNEFTETLSTILDVIPSEELISNRSLRREMVTLPANDGCTPLHKAAKRNSPDCIYLLINALPCQGSRIAYLGLQNDTGHTALHIAAINNCLAAVQAFLSTFPLEEIDAIENFLNKRSIEGKTALYEAAAKGYEMIVKELLNAGADPTICDEHDRTPQDIAAINGYEALANYLEKASIPFLHRLGPSVESEDEEIDEDSVEPPIFYRQRIACLRVLQQAG